MNVCTDSLLFLGSHVGHKNTGAFLVRFEGTVTY
jgi:hypothetical protein